MSFLKFWGNSKSSSSSKGKKEKENSHPKNKDTWPELTQEEQEEAKKFPFSDKQGRNLSISRSGRHKYKNKQRLTLSDKDDLYSSHKNVKATAGQQPSTSSYSQVGASASSSHARSGSYGNQGSLGRSSGGQCAVEESTKRYAKQTKLASQPTAV